MLKIFKIVASKQVVIVFILLFLLMAAVNDYVVDSIALSAMGMLGFGVIIYKLYELLLFVFRKRKPRIPWYDVIAILLIVWIAFFLNQKDLDTIASNGQSIADQIADCTKDGSDCIADLSEVKVEQRDAKTFLVTAGISTIFVRATTDDSQCLKINSLYVGNVINESRCSN